MTTLQDSRVLRVRSLGLKRRRASTVRAGLRPWIESLEDRAVPASLLYVDATWPGVSIPAPIVDVGGTPHTIGVDAFNTIQAAVDAADNGAVINVLAGSYDEAVTINKPVTLQGAGQAQTDVKRGMLITSPIVGDLRVGLKDLSIHAAQSVQSSTVAGLSTYGIRIDATAADTAPITFDHVTTQSPITLKPIGVAPSSQIYGSGILILPNNHVINDLNFTAVTASNNYTHGLLISDTSGKLGGTVSNLTIADSFFDSNNVKAVVDGSPGASGYGLYFNAPTAASSIVVTGVNVSNTSISNNRLKGAYLETLAHAAFTNINVTGNGGYANLAANGPAGFQLNLKYGTYHDIRIESSTFANNGLANTATGSGLSIQPRNDGIYAPIPASLANLQIVNSTISGSPIPLTLAYNLDYASTTLSGVSLNGSVVGLTMYNGTAGQTLNLGDTSFNAALPTYISSASSIVTHAESAVFDGIVGQNLTNAQAFAVSAKIGDALDPTIGLAGTVYIRPNELFVNSGAGNLPRGIAAAVAGDRVHVNTGTYVENLTIAKGIAVEGETGTILNVPSGDGISVTGLPARSN